MSRDGKLIALLGVLAVLCGTLVGGHFLLLRPPAPQVVSGPSRAHDRAVSVEFLGDTMLGDAALPSLRRYGYLWPFHNVSGLIDGDIVLANLEGPITTRKLPFNPLKDYNYTVDPAAARALATVGIDAVSLGNNHAMDSGPLGMQDTQRSLDKAGVASFGAGATLDEARRPLMLRTAAGTIGIVPLGEDFGSDVSAGPDQAGTVVLSPENVQRGLEDARRAGADWVVAMVHWGDNYSAVNASQRYWARALAQAGYDLVVGTGPHIPNRVAMVGDMPVAYSIGNFVFGSPGRFPNRALGVGLIMTATFVADEPIQVSFRCVVDDNDLVDFQPRPCSEWESERTWRLLGTDVVAEGLHGVMTVPRTSPGTPDVP
jgi:poly-gamma-glutamate capsule biosynthesis protein CapA/YwtB (metallophosphatase superfamily)